ncbi:putative transglutaminase elicitor [Plasmopara halstedii]
MIISPKSSFVFGGIVTIALQIQLVTPGSLYYGPYTVSGTDYEISEAAPFYGGEVADENCAIKVVDDPTLPDISTISTVPVKFQHLLANKSRAPVEPLYLKVGKVIIAEDTPGPDDDHDAYTTWTYDSPSMSNSVIQNVEQTDRRLEDNTNQNIAQLEAYFGKKLELTLSKLPTIGIYQPSPWSGPFWPSFEDSINIRWKKKQPSPAEKYALAFGLNATEITYNVSVHHGIESQTKRPKCRHDKTCKLLHNHSRCAIRAGQHEGYCIPMWFGLCHAWAPASILEPEPRCPVTYNGITFYPLDLKALITTVYAGAKVQTLFTGVRYKGLTNETDEFGRYKNAAQRDMNPGFFHIAMANILGRFNATFVVDVDSSAEVWNQPARGFKVFEQTAMSLEKAAQTFYGLSTYPWNAAAKSIVYIKSRLSWIAETYTDGGLVSSGRINRFTTGKYYYYILELDDAGIILGGEWVYNSTRYHPDFLWIPKARPDLSIVTNIGLSYGNVSLLVNASAACTPVISPEGSEASDSDDVREPPTEVPTLDNTETSPATPALNSPPTTPALNSPPTTPALNSPPTTPALNSPPTTPALNSPPTTPALDSPPATPALNSPPATPALNSPPATPPLNSPPTVNFDALSLGINGL